MRSFFAGACLMTSLLLCGAAQAKTYFTELASKFDQKIGVDTHLPYGDSTYGQGGTYDQQLAMTESQYLFGTRHPVNFRDGFSNGGGGSGASQISYFYEFAEGANGFDTVRFTALIENTDNPADPAGFSAPLILAQDVNAAVKSSVPYLEGDNEASNPTWVGDTADTPQAVNDQAAGLVAAVKSSITNKQLPSTTKTVFTSGWDAEIISPADTTNPVANNLADYDNVHPYPGFGSGPYTALSEAYTNGPKDPRFATEFGYPVCGLTGEASCSATPHTGAQQWVDESVRERYLLDAVMDANVLGIARVFFYELENGYAPNSQNFSPWGLFYFDNGFTPANNNIYNSDGTPNTTYVSATAIGLHNLFARIADPQGTLKTATKLAYSVSGLPTTCYGNVTQTTTNCTTSLAVENTGGEYFVVVWAEPKIWNSATFTEVTPASKMVTLTLPASGFSTYQVYDPSITSGSTEIASGAYTSTVKVTVTDHPIIIELLP